MNIKITDKDEFAREYVLKIHPHIKNYANGTFHLQKLNVFYTVEEIIEDLFNNVSVEIFIHICDRYNTDYSKFLDVIELKKIIEEDIIDFVEYCKKEDIDYRKYYDLEKE